MILTHSEHERTSLPTIKSAIGSLLFQEECDLPTSQIYIIIVEGISYYLIPTTDLRLVVSTSDTI
jgi:hypothetical protein